MGNTLEKVKSSTGMSKDEKYEGGKEDSDEAEDENNDSYEEEDENKDSDEEGENNDNDQDKRKRVKTKKKTLDRHICDEPDSFEEKDMAKLGFKLGKEIGRGSFSVVKGATYKGSDEVIVAKIIKTKRDDIYFPQIFMIRETDVISKIRHPYIIKFYKVYVYPEKIFMYSEKFVKGSLFDFLKKYGPLPNENYGRRIFQQLLEGMNYLHDLNIAHRDLKLENIMLEDDHSIRIIDFGFCKPVSYNSENYMSDTYCGSPQYAPPELFEQNLYNIFQADVWSLGVVIFIAQLGRLPFPQDSSFEVKKALEAGKFNYPKSFEVSDEFKDLNKCMMNIECSKRWTMKELLTHRWVIKEDSSEEDLSEEDLF